MAEQVRILIANLAAEERSPEVAAAGLRDIKGDSGQYFWIELASLFPTAPEVIEAATEVLKRRDETIATHLLVDLLAESGDPSTASALVELIEAPSDFDPQEALCVRALEALFAIDPELARRCCEDHQWFMGRENLAVAAEELFEEQT